MPSDDSSPLHADPRPAPADPAGGDDQPPRTGWLARVAWLALGLGVLRAAVLLAMEGAAHETEWLRLTQRLGTALPSLLLTALACAAAAAVLLRGVGSSGSGARRAVGALAVAATTALVTAFLTGRLSDDASRLVGLHTSQGQVATGVLALLALVLSMTGRAALRRRQGEAPAPRGVVPPAVLLLVTALALPPFLGRPDAVMTVTRVDVDLLADLERLAIVTGPPPRVAVLSPSSDYKVDGADLPALIAPPPSTLRLTVPPGGPRDLVLRAGLDQSMIVRHEDDLAGHVVAFRVEVEGQAPWTTEIPFTRVGEMKGSAWVPMPPARVEPGATVTLSTRLLDPTGQELDGAPSDDEILAGFGELSLRSDSQVPRQPSSPEAPNIVFVVMDTLRADRLSTYGYERPTSPRLDELAARGLVFDEALSTASWTWPSTASLLTGLLPEQHGVVGEGSCHLSQELTTLAEALQRQGVTTAAWSGNPLIVPDKSFDQGFEFFDHGRGARKSSHLVPAANEWISAMAGTRFFLYLQLMEVHSPLTPLPEARAALAADVPDDFSPQTLPELAKGLRRGKGHDDQGRMRTAQVVTADQRRHVSDLYDACVRSGDQWFGQILDTLEAEGLSDETVIVFTSDHGEELFEHGLATHGQSLYRELVRVPLVMAGPGVPTGRVAAPVSNRHLAPTLVRLAGSELDDVEDGLDLLGPPADTSLRRRPVLLSTWHGWWNNRWRQPIHGVRLDEWVLHWAPEGGPWGSDDPDPQGQWRLYDVARDPGEQHDLSSEQPDRADRLRDSLAERLADLTSRRVGLHVEAGDATLDLLRRIGYIGDDG